MQTIYRKFNRNAKLSLIFAIIETAVFSSGTLLTIVNGPIVYFLWWIPAMVIICVFGICAAITGIIGIVEIHRQPNHFKGIRRSIWGLVVTAGFVGAILINYLLTQGFHF